MAAYGAAKADMYRWRRRRTVAVNIDRIYETLRASKVGPERLAAKGAEECKE